MNAIVKCPICGTANAPTTDIHGLLLVVKDGERFKPGKPVKMELSEAIPNVVQLFECATCHFLMMFAAS